MEDITKCIGSYQNGGDYSGDMRKVTSAELFFERKVLKESNGLTFEAPDNHLALCLAAVYALLFVILRIG